MPVVVPCSESGCKESARVATNYTPAGKYFCRNHRPSDDQADQIAREIAAQSDAVETPAEEEVASEPVEAVDEEPV